MPGIRRSDYPPGPTGEAAYRRATAAGGSGSAGGVAPDPSSPGNADLAQAAGDVDDLMPQSDDPDFAELSDLARAVALTKARKRYNNDPAFREDYRKKKQASRDLKARLLEKAKATK